MVRDGAEVKRERMQTIAQLITSLLLKDNKISLSKTLSIIEYKTGLTQAKIMEYLRTLEKLGRFEIDVENDDIKKIIES
ncbi:hypothetical protein MUP77_00880 [Candidatus Bathyarchaeota archaeon]|nr:hypothetical protein [Candidatus Bathyarchaeota archaeon]